MTNHTTPLDNPTWLIPQDEQPRHRPEVDAMAMLIDYRIEEGESMPTVAEFVEYIEGSLAGGAADREDYAMLAMFAEVSFRRPQWEPNYDSLIEVGRWVRNTWYSDHIPGSDR